jgi:hypothetical protein
MPASPRTALPTRRKQRGIAPEADAARLPRRRVRPSERRPNGIQWRELLDLVSSSEASAEVEIKMRNREGFCLNDPQVSRTSMGTTISPDAIQRALARRVWDGGAARALGERDIGRNRESFGSNGQAEGDLRPIAPGMTSGSTSLLGGPERKPALRHRRRRNRTCPGADGRGAIQGPRPAESNRQASRLRQGCGREEGREGSGPSPTSKDGTT